MAESLTNLPPREVLEERIREARKPAKLCLHGLDDLEDQADLDE